MAIDENARNTYEDDFADDELRDLFTAFEDVSASEQLQQDTLAKIIASRDCSEPAPCIEAVPGGKSYDAAYAGTVKPRKRPIRAKWRAIRVAAVAACLVLALTGGVAYATPATHYEVVQGTTTVTLGVNCFGITISTESNDEDMRHVIESASLGNLPYEESVSRTIEIMEQHEPTEPIEFGPKGGDRERIEPQADGRQTESDAGQPQEEGRPEGPGEGQPQRDQNPVADAPHNESPSNSDAASQPDDPDPINGPQGSEGAETPFSNESGA